MPNLDPCEARQGVSHCALVADHTGLHRALVWTRDGFPVLIAFTPDVVVNHD